MNTFTNFNGQSTLSPRAALMYNIRQTTEGRSNNGPIEGEFVDPQNPSNPDGRIIQYQDPNTNGVYSQPVNSQGHPSGWPQHTDGCDSYKGGSYQNPVSNWPGCPAGYDRSITPESLLADSAHPIPYLRDKARGLPSWISDSEACDMQRVIDDYTQVGTVGQTRAAIEALYAFGGFGDVRIAGILAGANDVATFPVANLPVSIGFRLDWGIQLLNYAPFDMNIHTVGWSTASTILSPQSPLVDADRIFTTRVQKVSGGSIFVPWAARVTPGMSVAQQVMAVSVEVVAATISVENLPAAIAASFSMQVTLLTAFHPLTAQFATAIGAYVGGR